MNLNAQTLSTYQSLEEKQDPRILQTRVVNTIEELESEIHHLDLCDKQYIYRGVSEAYRKMYTSAQRAWMTQGYSKRNEFQNDINRFIAKCIAAVKSDKLLQDYYSTFKIPATDVLYLSLMQHYGAPSPLLDFTYDIRTALYFACQNLSPFTASHDIQNYFSIYYHETTSLEMRLDNFLINGLSSGADCVRDFKNKHPYTPLGTELLDDLRETLMWYQTKNPQEGLHRLKDAFIDNPKYTKEVKTPFSNQILFWANHNILAQEGCFMLYNEYDKPNLPLEDYFAEHKHIPFSCIDIHKSLAGYIKENYLQGSTEATLFPDLSSIVTDCAAGV